MDRVPIESAWRRGWSDTKAAVTSWWFVLADAALGLLTGVAIGNWQGTLWGAGAGAGAILGFAFLLLLWNLHRAPIRQRNEEWGREKQREQLHPVIGTQLEARVLRSKGDFWLYSPRVGLFEEPSELGNLHLLKVTNPSGIAIADYYAKFRDFRDPHNRAIDDLMGYELYWHETGSDLPKKRISIPSEKSRHLHMFTTLATGNEVGLSQVVGGKYRQHYKALHSISIGEHYTAILEIGSSSEKASVPPVDVELKIKYHGIHSLSAEIRAGPHIDIGPPAPDSTGL